MGTTRPLEIAVPADQQAHTKYTSRTERSGTNWNSRCVCLENRCLIAPSPLVRSRVATRISNKYNRGERKTAQQRKREERYFMPEPNCMCIVYDDIEESKLISSWSCYTIHDYIITSRLCFQIFTDYWLEVGHTLVVCFVDVHEVAFRHISTLGTVVWLGFVRVSEPTDAGAGRQQFTPQLVTTATAIYSKNLLTSVNYETEIKD